MTGMMSFSIGVLVFISLYLSLLDASILLKCDIQIKANVSKNKGKTTTTTTTKKSIIRTLR